MADLRQWWKTFTKPYPRGLRTVRGAALAAVIVGGGLFVVHLAAQGPAATLALFPEPVREAAHRVAGLFASEDPDPVPWRRHIPTPPDTFTLVEHAARTWRGGTDTFVRAPIRDDALPYSESPHAPVSEVVKQVDYALTQFMLRRDLGWHAVHLVSLERVPEPGGKGTYLYQRLRLYLPPDGSAGVSRDVEETVEQLRRILGIWCERGTLERVGPLHLRVTVGAAATHDIFLSPRTAPIPTPPPDNTPLLTLVIDDMGASPEAARALLDLGIPLTFSVWPRAAHARRVAEAAWTAGQEVMIHQPCEPREYPAMQPGPGAVFVRMPPEEIRAVVRENIGRVPHAVGMNNHMGSRLTADARASAALSAVAAEEGLFVLDSMTHPTSVLGKTAAGMGIAAYRRVVFLDDPLSPAAIRAALRTAETLARKHGQAVAIGHPHPETIAALREWAGARDTRIRLVPLRMQKPYTGK